MNLAFTYENPVNYFRVLGELSPQDLRVIHTALFRFFETSPGYVVLDLCGAKNLCSIPHTELNRVITEIESFANASKVTFQVIHTELEARQASSSILQKAIQEKTTLLKLKNSVKEDLRSKAKTLQEENEALKIKLETTISPSEIGSLTSVLDRFWSSSK